MKTKALFFSLFVAAAGIVACSQEDARIAPDEEQEKQSEHQPDRFADPGMASLNTSIQTIQQQLFCNNPQTRVISHGDTFISVILADVFGDYICQSNGIQTSCGFSAEASWRAFKRYLEQKPWIIIHISSLVSLAPTDSVVINTGMFQTYVDSTGYYHNLVLNDAFQQYGDSLCQMEVTSLIEAFDGIVSDELGVSATQQQKTLFRNISNTMDNAQANSTSLSGFCANLKAAFPADSDRITVLQTYVNGLAMGGSSEAKRAYTQQVLSQINTLVTDADVRQALKAGVNTGFASDRLWNF